MARFETSVGIDDLVGNFVHLFLDILNKISKLGL